MIDIFMKSKDSNRNCTIERLMFYWLLWGLKDAHEITFYSEGCFSSISKVTITKFRSIINRKLLFTTNIINPFLLLLPICRFVVSFSMSILTYFGYSYSFSMLYRSCPHIVSILNEKSFLYSLEVINLRFNCYCLLLRKIIENAVVKRIWEDVCIETYIDEETDIIL